MTEHQTMNTIIHAALRRDLARFDAALAAFPGTQARADQLWTAWENYAHQLHQHHEDEETIFFPAMQEVGADGSLVGELDGEHQRMAAALDAATTAMKALHQGPSADNANAARESVAAFGTILHDHLAHEERDLEPFAVANLKGTPQFKAAQAAVRKSMKGQAGTFFAWLSDGAGAEERSALAREIPRPVLFVIKTFGGRDYRRRIAPVWS
ncbi:MAG TPA: hemerythrin domain-containing protein [Actinophytocola sp.]|nr:hemerythrin domain-containing protein [Actinophytocola sp.]